MKEFASAAATFAGLGADVVARLAGLAADLCIVVDADGVVRDASVSSDEIPAALAQSWVGQPIENIVVQDSRHKLAELLAAGAHDDAVRWRQLNLLADGGAQWMLQCAALRLDAEGVLVVVARSLQSTAVLQQRLVQAQQAMERDYWQFRDAETRYRQLFQSSSEGVLVLEADNLTVVEANPAACRVLELDDSALVGRPLPALFWRRQRGCGRSAGRCARRRAAGRSHGPPRRGPGRRAGVGHRLPPGRCCAAAGAAGAVWRRGPR